MTLPVQQATSQDDDGGNAQRQVEPVPQGKVRTFSAVEMVQMLVDGIGHELREESEKHRQRSQDSWSNPQDRFNLVHLLHGFRSCAALGCKSPPQKSQRISHGEYRAQDDCDEHQIARHANEQWLIHDRINDGFFGDKTEQRRDARHGQGGENCQAKDERLFARQARKLWNFTGSRGVVNGADNHK